MYKKNTVKTILINETPTEVNATAQIVELSEVIVGYATARIKFFTGAGKDLDADIAFTTVVPEGWLTLFRRVMSQAATALEVEQVHQLILYSPEGNIHAPVVTPENVPDLDGFKTALFQSSVVPMMAKSQLMLTYPLLDTYTFTNPIMVSSAWAVIKGSEYSYMTSEVIAEVEKLGEQFHIPLIAIE